MTFSTDKLSSSIAKLPKKSRVGNIRRADILERTVLAKFYSTVGNSPKFNLVFRIKLRIKLIVIYSDSIGVLKNKLFFIRRNRSAIVIFLDTIISKDYAVNGASVQQRSIKSAKNVFFDKKGIFISSVVV